jgi:hypothetical protein
VIRVEVTEEHIKKGQASWGNPNVNRSQTCPVAQAVKSVLGKKFRGVAANSLSYVSRHGILFHVNVLPDEVNAFIDQADGVAPETDGLLPFSFELELSSGLPA